MNETNESHPESHSSQGQPQEQPIQSSASSSSCSGSTCSSTPQAEIAFVAQPVETPVIQPVTAQIVEATATAPVAHQQTLPVAQASECCAQAQAPVAVATVTETAPPVVAPTLTDAAANDLAAAVTSAQRARSRAKSNSRGPRPSDLIEKKIVIRRDRWDALIKLTETLHSERAVKAEPSEVAAIVLEAGLGAIIEESRQKATTIVAPTKAKAVKAKKAHVKLLPKAVAKHGKAAAKGKAKAKHAPRPTRAAPAKPRTFAASELQALKGLVRGLRSDRSVQRTLALWLGAHSPKGSIAVPIEDLRALCKEFKVYDTANFAQNMKKDSSYFTEVRDKSGDRLGYSLTAAGAQAIQSLFASSK